MNPFGAAFTITLIILILAWPFLAIYIAQRIAVPRTRQGFTACGCSSSDKISGCPGRYNNAQKSTKIYAPHSGEAP